MKSGKFSASLKTVLRYIRKKGLSFWDTAGVVARSKAVETIEYETAELENIFGVLVLGAFIGVPSPPIQITMELLPEMDQELHIMLEKISTAHDPLGDLFSVLGID